MTFKEEINLPKAGLTPRGKVSIDLMDTEGNIVETHKKDNYVHTRLLELLGEFTMRGSIRAEYTSIPAGSGTTVGLVSQVRGILLTDNSAPPNPAKERHIDGNIIGGGNIESIYDSDWLGSFNSSESVLSQSYLKLVFDFPTSAGNGTFQSIYTGPFTSMEVEDERNFKNNPTRILQTKGGVDDTRSGTYGITGWYKFGEEVHFAKGDIFSRGVSQLNVAEFSTMEALYNKQDWKETFALPHNVDGVTLDTKRGVYYFYAEGSASDWNIWTAPYDNPTEFTLRLNRSMPAGNHWYLYGLVYDDRTDTMIVSGWSAESTGSSTHRGVHRASMPKMEPLENILPGQFILNPSLSRDGRILYIGDGNSSGTVGYDLKNKRYVSAVGAGSVNSYNTHGIYREISDDLAFFGRYYSRFTSDTGSNYVALEANFDFFSRAVLDSPVTKTAQNTMKITYEFTVDDFMV